MSAVQLEADTKKSRWSEFAMRGLLLPAERAILAGVIADAAGRPIPNATVRIEQNGHPSQQTASDTAGNYQLEVYPAEGNYDLSATSEERGAWWLNLQLRQGERRTVNLRLQDAVSIEGRLVMFDDKTPQVSIPVEAVQMSNQAINREGEAPAEQSNNQAINTQSSENTQYAMISIRQRLLNPSRNTPHVSRFRRVEPVETTFHASRVVATALSNDAGKYRFVNLLPGRYLVRCQVSGGYVNSPRGPITVQPGKPVKNIDFRLANFKKGKWTSYSTFNGLVDNRIRSICQDKEGLLWFGTTDGVSRYDGNSFVNFTVNEGQGNTVSALYCDSSGTVWLGTGNGVYRYDGDAFVRFTVADGLVDFGCSAIHQDTKGVIWFGTGGGISRYDGKTIVNLTAAEGLGDSAINAIYEDAEGRLWCGTNAGGVSRYDGKTFVTFTTADGLADNDVQAIVQSPDGAMWFGTAGGVSRFDG
ncbi:carboxypeptidase regulatory-like domain-containing protein, partial [Candidatus Poribacteria bacterium]|nr:carboxypeptidase regulatory-like domain-containing protein [Candidatus Poribacteria bacterium]